MSAALIAQMRAKRTTWLDLGDGVAVAIMRPTEAQMAPYIRPLFIDGKTVQDAALSTQYVTDWRGVTEATLLGDSIGSTTPVQFVPELWAEVVADHAAWGAAVAQAVVDAMQAHLVAKTTSAGKSTGSSTNPPTGSYSATTDPSPATPSA